MSTALDFREKLRTVPLLRALVPMAAGIVAGTLIPIQLYVWAIATGVCALVAGISLSRRGAYAGLYVGLTILFFGAALAHVHAPAPVVPHGERVWMEVVLTDPPTTREGRRSASTFGTVTRWQPDTSTTSGDASSPSPEDWRAAGERLLVRVDTMWRFEAGDRITFRSYVNPISDSTSSYSRLMWARGYTGRTYISQYSRPAVARPVVARPGPRDAKKSVTWAKKLQSAATERINRLNFTPDTKPNTSPDAKPAAKSDKPPTAMSDATAEAISEAISVATAMTTGDRSGITPEVRRSYARTGASHLLAVSGLHVGIVFLIINVLLYLLPLLFSRAHIVKNIIAIAAIWLYAALTGLSPSATRAAFMFTGAQIALATSQTRGPANIMCGTALIMLTVRPGLVWDISFQLSFIAVAGILAWFTPLYRLVESRWRGLNALWATLIVGLAASLATMPLVSHTFGIFSPAGIVLNPLIITTAHFIVGASLVWIAAPVGVLEPVFRWLVAGPAWLQNRVVATVADISGAAVEWTMPLWMVFAVYAAMIIFTAWVVGRTRREDEPFVLQ